MQAWTRGAVPLQVRSEAFLDPGEERRGVLLYNVRSLTGRWYAKQQVQICSVSLSAFVHTACARAPQPQSARLEIAQPAHLPRSHYVTHGSCTLPQAHLQRNFGAGCVSVPYIIYSDETHVTLHGTKFHPVNISLALPGLHQAEHGYQRVALLSVIEPEDFKMTSGDFRRVH